MAESLDVRYIVLDISDSEDIKAAKKFIEQEFGKLDILVNNAAVFLDGEWYGNNVETVSTEILRDTRYQLFGTVELTRAILPLIKK